MVRFLIMVALCAVAASPAHASDIDATYAQWERLRSPDTANISFADGTAFLNNHAGWPEEKIIRLRTETAAMTEHPSHAQMMKFCIERPPISGRGMVACASAGVGTPQEQATAIKQAWLQGDFSEDEEQRILKSYSGQLTSADHTARMERLLYESKISAAKRMLLRVSADKRPAYLVRLAFIGKDGRAPHLLKHLPAAQQNDAGMLFARLRWRMDRSDDEGLAELLLAAPKTVPYPDLWWPMRAVAARDAIGKRNYPRALAVVANHGDLKGEALAEALWLKGWLCLRRSNDAQAAYKHFFALYTSVSTPVSKARAAYWAGRAAEKNGNKDIAIEWMGKAAKQPTVFYGQLAQHWLKPGEPLALPDMPEPTDAEKSAFAKDELVRVIRGLGDDADTKMRDLFIATLAAREESSDGKLALLAKLADQLGGVASGVDVAKLALRNGVVLIDAGWPRIALPSNLKLEPALTLAITRQESEFNPTARSAANARGLMQLLPATAKQTARKLDMDYHDSMLENPLTNMTLGSQYLGQIIDGFDGSYILGIASYNAGPGSVRNWIAAMGKPPKRLDDAIDWVESIPFGETRNYVMRALENVSVYRSLANPEAPLMIEKDLLR